MPVQRTPLVQSFVSKYNDLVPTLGKLSKDVVENLDNSLIDIKGYEPGTIRRPAPIPIANANFPSNSNARLAGAAFASASGQKTPLYKGANYGAAALQSTSLLQRGQATLDTVGEILEKFDPSSVIGVIKGSLKESADAARRLFGGALLELESFATQPEYRKLILGQNLTEEEDRKLMQEIFPALEASMQKAGYNDIEKQRALSAVAADVFNVSSTAASVIPVAGATGSAVKTLAGGGGKALLTQLSLKGGQQAVKEAIKDGLPLIVDDAGNVFARTTTKNVVKGFLNEGYKDVLKLADDTIGSIIKKTYTQGLGLEGVQQMRKFIDPESAERIARDQRQFIDSLSPAERIALDIGLGLYLPLEIPGLDSVKRVIKDGGDLVARADIARAIDTTYNDSQSLAVLDRISKFRDVETDLPLDIQLTGDLREHLVTVMRERDVTATVEHAREELKRFAGQVSDPNVAAGIARDEAEGRLRHLSWYSESLGRALEPHEQLMHWFITETERKYIGDVGANLEKRFEEALQARTTGRAATTQTVYRAVASKVSDLKQITGNVVRAGEASAVREAMDVVLVSKTGLLAELMDLSRKYGQEIVDVNGQFRIPNSLMEIPEVKSLVEGIRELRTEVDDIIAQGRALGMPEDILSVKDEASLLKEFNIYNQVMGIKTLAAANMSARATAFENLNMSTINKVKRYYAKTGEADKILTGDSKIAKEFRANLVDGEIRGSLLPSDATDEDILNFVLSIPTKSDGIARIPEEAVNVLKKGEQESLAMSKAISRFDNDILQATRNGALEPKDEWTQSIIKETRRIEAQLPTGAFAPQHIVQQNRWNTGITEVPLVDASTAKIPGWASVVAKLQDANGVTRKITDYLVPHNPADIYVKAMNKLESKLEELSPGNTAEILREVSKIQDKGISILPAIPGGGPQWEALGKPMISGVQWGQLDDIGKRFGIDNLGQISRESFINSLSESGLKPGLVDRLRAAPGIGQLFDSLYRQYMLARFAFNPIFHLQQMPEAALMGVLRSFNLPPEMSGKYLKSIIRNPTKALTVEEGKLYDLLQNSDLFSKTAKKGIDLTLETKAGDDIAKATRWEEAKRFHAFVAEFPVRLRGELFQMPALKNADPLTIEQFRDRILSLQNNPEEIAKVISSAASDNRLDVWPEAVRRAVNTTNKEVQKLTTYNLNRSALEKDLHSIFFPFSFGKKVWSELSGAMFGKNATIVTPFGTFQGGGVIKPVMFSNMIDGYEAANEQPSMMQIRARFPTMTGWIMNMTPINPDYPLINLEQGSVGFGGFRGQPEQAIITDTLTGGKYDLSKGDDTPLTKFGSYRFFGKELPSAYKEIFAGDTTEQQDRYNYLLNRMRLERELRNKEKEQD